MPDFKALFFQNLSETDFHDKRKLEDEGTLLRVDLDRFCHSPIQHSNGADREISGANV
jgi:hypothetical protein